MFTLEVVIDNSEDLTNLTTLLELLEQGIHANITLASLKPAIDNLLFNANNFILVSRDAGSITPDDVDLLDGMATGLRRLADQLDEVIVQISAAPIDTTPAKFHLSDKS